MYVSMSVCLSVQAKKLSLYALAKDPAIRRSVLKFSPKIHRELPDFIRSNNENLYSICIFIKAIHGGLKTSIWCHFGWRLGVVVSVVGRINEVNQDRARLVHDG